MGDRKRVSRKRKPASEEGAKEPKRHSRKEVAEARFHDLCSQNRDFVEGALENRQVLEDLLWFVTQAGGELRAVPGRQRILHGQSVWEPGIYFVSTARGARQSRDLADVLRAVREKWEESEANPHEYISRRR